MTLIAPRPLQVEPWKDAIIDHEKDSDSSIISQIREWLYKQPHLPHTLEDKFLLNFYKGCKCSMERTKRKLDNYFTMRTAAPEFFSNRDPTSPEMKRIFDIGYSFVLPDLTPKGYQVAFVRLRDNLDPARFEFHQAVKYMLLGVDVVMNEQDMKNGYIAIFDMAAIKLAHLARLTVVHAKKFIMCIQEAYPQRTAEIHIINAPPFVHKTITIFKSFMKEKLRNRIHVYGSDLTRLHQSVPKESLPSELGGEAGTLDEFWSNWVKCLENNRDWILQQEYLKSDERKRPGRPKTQGDLFGVEGSFRQLTLD